MSKNPKRHRWEFSNGGHRKKSVVWSRGRWGRTKVELLMTKEHYLRALELGGIGDGHNCTAGVCANESRDKFPHPVVDYVDFQDSRLFIASALDKVAMPAWHYVYMHHSDIPKLFDTAEGRKVLLRRLEEGPIKITLYPAKPDTPSDHPRISGPRPPRGAEPVRIRAKHVPRRIRRKLDAA